MRVRLVGIAVAVAVLGAAGRAGAVPNVSLDVRAVPISGFAHTGDFAGAGASLELEVRVEGSEFDGGPPGMMFADLYLPAGTVLHISGFPTCAQSVLEPPGPGPKYCPKGSVAGVTGESQVIFPQGGEPVLTESARIEQFFQPGGRLFWLTFGTHPQLLESLASVRFVPSKASSAEKLEVEPGTDASEGEPGGHYPPYSLIKLRIGTAVKRGRRSIYSLRLPASCPKRYLPFAASLTFEPVKPLAGFPGFKSTPEQTVTAKFRAPCPRRTPD